jgi:hypothetical protein
LAGLHLLSALLSTLLSGLLPSGLVLISLVIYICHKNISPSRFIDYSCGRVLRHTLSGNDRFGSEDQYFAHAVKIYDSFSGASFPFSIRAGHAVRCLTVRSQSGS